MTLPPQGLNLNEYLIESWVTAPQAPNFAFLGHKSAKISFLCIRFLFTRPVARLSFGVFFLGGGKLYVGPLLGFWGGHGRIAPPPGSASEMTWKPVPAHRTIRAQM